MRSSRTSGKVYLIGAGPGDPSLLTLKGKELLTRADIVIYDYLVNPKILVFARPGAKKVYVGKKGRAHTREQWQINRLLVRYARKGMTVSRLKGGDPFIFGRGGEEAAYLASHRIPFEIVPGISSAVAGPAYAGIPITHRDHSSMVTMMTGHSRTDGSGDMIDWDNLSPDNTLVILMGMGNLSVIINKLLNHQWPAKTPVALVRWGTLPAQETIIGTLSDIRSKVKDAHFRPPAVIIVGSVVNLRKKLRWFDNKPLFGRRIIITRAREQASALAKLLEDNGAQVIEFPTIKIIPPKSYRPLDRAIRDIHTFDWLVFTSVNGVEHFWKRWQLHDGNMHRMKQVRTCAIGPKTAERMITKGMHVNRIAREYRAESVLHVLGNVQNKRILIPRAHGARDFLPLELQKRSADVTVVPAYETVKDTSHLREIKNILLDRKNTHPADCVTFTSSSTVTNFMECFSAQERKKIFKNITVASIGPITSHTVSSYGIKPNITAKIFTIEHLTDAIVHYFKKNNLRRAP